jgi:hypothetical protein
MVPPSAGVTGEANDKILSKELDIRMDNFFLNQYQKMLLRN